jgi:hypothetical protein
MLGLLDTAEAETDFTLLIIVMDMLSCKITGEA